MKYFIKTVETEIYNREYIVEANSGDEAEELIYNGEATVNNESLDYTDDIQILEIEPCKENIE